MRMGNVNNLAVHGMMKLTAEGDDATQMALSRTDILVCHLM